MVLNLNWEIIWVFVDLLILFLLMKKFLFGPVTKLLDQRAKGVTDTIEQAESQLAQAQQQKQAYTQQLDQARKQAELNYNRRMEEAAQDVRRLNEQAARQRQADQEAMLAETRRQVAGLVLLTTAKVSQRTLDGETDQAMLDELLEEVGNEP